jgi:hypothetical protein
MKKTDISWGAENLKEQGENVDKLGLSYTFDGNVKYKYFDKQLVVS